MKSDYLSDRFEFIDDAITYIEHSGVKDEKMLSMLSSYLCVLISGIYEDSVEYLFQQRAGKNGDTELSSLIQYLIDKQFRNPFYASIKDLVENLNPSFAVAIHNKAGMRGIEAINSIVTNKNNLAHGKYAEATFNDVKQYHESAKCIIEELERLLV